MPQEALDWVRKMIEYNVKGGKLNRGLTVGSPPVCLLVCLCVECVYYII